MLIGAAFLAVLPHSVAAYTTDEISCLKEYARLAEVPPSWLRSGLPLDETVNVERLITNPSKAGYLISANVLYFPASSICFVANDGGARIVIPKR